MTPPDSAAIRAGPFVRNSAFFRKEIVMASNTMATWHKRTRRHQNMGRKRKNQEARNSTPSEAQLFAACGEPGKPAPAQK